MEKFMICRAKVEDYTKLVVCLQPQPQTVTEHDAIGWTLNRCPQEIGEGKGQHTHGQWGFATDHKLRPTFDSSGPVLFV